MTIAAAYARYSSDAQRDESIEIQLREIDTLIKHRGWVKGPQYHDHARTGRDGNRPQFQQCIADAEAHKFDVLVVYSVDRLARNVSLAQETKTKLFRAGVRLVSVREGEMEDTPEGFLMSGIFDLWAEHYSRNLSVKVRGGMWDSAMKCKACGNYHFGYDVDAEDHYVINEYEADYVRQMFDMYLAGRTMNEIRDHLNREGVLTRRGKKWSVQTIAQLMGKPIYKGTYSFMGHVEEGAVPAIVSDEDWEAAQVTRTRKKNMKRRRIVNDYLLTDKIYCLECGRPMCGTAGTSATGKKYTYYGCVLQEGCGKRVSSELVEQKAMEAVAALLDDEPTMEALVKEITAWSFDRMSKSVVLIDELKDLEAQRDKLVDAIADGVPAQSVAKKIVGIEDRIAELNDLIEKERPVVALVPTEEMARKFLENAKKDATSSDPMRRLLASSFIDKVFINKEQALIVLRLSQESIEFTIDEVRSLVDEGNLMKSANKLGKQPVRTHGVWWGTIVPLRTNQRGTIILRVTVD